VDDGAEGVRMTWHPDMPESYRDAIVTGDARELAKAIPDSSVDLIFTDPVYDRIDDYRWLAETACRVLRPGGACLVWSNGKWHRRNSLWLEAAGLIYRYDFASVLIRAAAPMNGRIISKANRVIWLDRSGDSSLIGYLADGCPSTCDPSLGKHPWGKDPRFVAYAMQAFVPRDALVFDPFCGGGVTAAVCRMTTRHYVAFEIDPATAERARERVANTTPPLPGIDEPEQLALEEV
jgi:hypothetical protein